MTTFVCKGFPDIGGVFLQLTLFKGYLDPQKFSGIPQAWTLTVEETFYLLAPLFFVALKRKYSLLSLFLGVSVIGGIFSLTTVNFLNWPGSFVPYYTFFGMGSLFFVGMGLAKFMIKQQSLSQKRTLKTSSITYLSLALGIILIVLMGAFSHTQDLQFYYYSPSMIILRRCMLPFVIVFHFYGLLTESTIWRTILSSRPFQILGWSSYAFYLIHLGPIAEWYQKVGFFGDLIGLFLFLHFVSIVIFYMVEKPCQYWIKKLLKNRAKEVLQ